MTEPIAWTRWLAKKVARFACVLAPVTDPGATRVLMYHRVRARARDPFSVSPAAFDRQMAWLRAEGRAIDLATLGAGLRGERPLPPGAVLVTIDDGFADTYSTALPILRTHGVPAVLFVSVGAVEDRPGGAPGPDAHVSWRELAALEAGGVTVASHGWDHVSLGRMTAAQVGEQLERSRDELRRRLGIAADAFAYPFGTRADFSAATATAVARAGYRLVFTAQHGAITPSCPPLELPRIKVEGGEGMWVFRRLVAGGLDRWNVVDQRLWRLQASGGRS